MGLMISLFGRSDKEEYTENTDNKTPEEKFPELHNDMALGLETPDGQHILTGRLSGYSSGDNVLTLERLPGELSLGTCEIGKTVTVQGINTSLAPFYLKGVVQKSTRVVCQLKDVVFTPPPANRHEFRLHVSSPAIMYYRSDKALGSPEECTLVDISTGGACVESKYLHNIDDAMRLKVKLMDYAPMEFIGEIIRMEEQGPGMYRYGFLFAQLSDLELANLSRTLYNIQHENFDTWKRSKVGYWGLPVTGPIS